jgi:hypothetical protein
MSGYDNDPRVKYHEDGSLTVCVSPGAEAHVVSGEGRYRAFATGQLVGGMWMEFATSDEAIRSLIGDPQ